jgi:hypothetical protein
LRETALQQKPERCRDRDEQRTAQMTGANARTEFSWPQQGQEYSDTGQRW